MPSRSARVAALLAAGASAAVLLLSCSAGTEPAGPPRRVVLESGDGQTTVAGRPFTTPLVVRVLGDHDRPVANAEVHVVVGRDNGGTGFTVGTSGTDGRVTLAPRAAPKAGEQAVEVQVGDLPPKVGSVQAVAGAPETIAPYVGDAQSDTVGRLLAAPLVAVVRDTFGNTVPGASVSWRVRAGGGALSDVGTATSSAGLVQARVTLGPVAGVDSIEATITTTHGPASVEFMARALSPAAAVVQVVSGAGQVTTAGAMFATAPVFRVLDAANRPIPGTVVTFSTSAGGLVDPARTVTDSSGTARITSWRAGTRAGSDSLVAVVGAASAVVPGSVIAGAPARLVIRSGLAAADTVVSGLVMSPRVVIEVADSAGNAVPDAAVSSRSVRVSVVSGVGRLAAQVAATTAGDTAVFDTLIVSGGGPHVLRFESDGMIAATTRPIYAEVRAVALTVAPHVAVVDSGAAFSPALTVADTLGTVAGAQVRWRVSDSTVATVDTSGRTATSRRGEALVIARSVYAPDRRDSALVIVAAPGGPVLAADLERFALPRDTTITLTIRVDARTGAPIGSATAALSWNPSMFTYVSSAAANGAPLIAINDADATSGSLRFAFADANGRAGSTALLTVTLHATGAGTGALALSASQLSAADGTLSALVARTTAVSTPVTVP